MATLAAALRTAGLSGFFLRGLTRARRAFAVGFFGGGALGAGFFGSRASFVRTIRGGGLEGGAFFGRALRLRRVVRRRAAGPLRGNAALGFLELLFFAGFLIRFAAALAASGAALDRKSVV